jgi:hypothetical protein
LSYPDYELDCKSDQGDKEQRHTRQECIRPLKSHRGIAYAKTDNQEKSKHDNPGRPFHLALSGK